MMICVNSALKVGYAGLGGEKFTFFSFFVENSKRDRYDVKYAGFTKRTRSLFSLITGGYDVTNPTVSRVYAD